MGLLSAAKTETAVATTTVASLRIRETCRMHYPFQPELLNQLRDAFGSSMQPCCGQPADCVVAGVSTKKAAAKAYSVALPLRLATGAILRISTYRSFRSADSDFELQCRVTIKPECRFSTSDKVGNNLRIARSQPGFAKRNTRPRSAAHNRHILDRRTSWVEW